MIFSLWLYMGYGCWGARQQWWTAIVIIHEEMLPFLIKNGNRNHNCYILHLQNGENGRDGQYN